MFTVSVEVAGSLFPIKFGATGESLSDSKGLACGLSAGIGRPGVNRGTVQTVEGPKCPDAVVVTDAAGTVVCRFVDYRDTAGDAMLELVGYRHVDGLVVMTGGAGI